MFSSISVLTWNHCSQDADPFLNERKESRTPLKKNRRRLDPTAEEEDNSSGSGGSCSTSPPIVASPRQEMKIKVRQISQGVEDISWKNMQNITSEDADVVVEDSEATLEPALELTTEKDEVNHHPVIDEDSKPLATPNRLRARSESGEKGLKRKFLERGTSQGPTENEESSNHAPEPLKRPRDESDKDDNPREAKRPSPPPSPPRSSPPKVLKPVCLFFFLPVWYYLYLTYFQSGFMAYASTSSPFASVKGQNIFMSGKVTPSPPPPSGSPASTAALPNTATPGQSSTTTPTAAKRSGFAAFASTPSPFAAAARTKSPILGSPSILGRAKSPPRRTKISNPFASFAGPAHSFAISASKRTPNGSSRSSLERHSTASTFGGSADGSDSGPEEDGDNRPSSFGERLRAAKDHHGEMADREPQVQLSEQDGND